MSIRPGLLGSRYRRIDHVAVSVSRDGTGEASTVHVTGLPPLSQDDARWLLNELAKVTLMPSRGGAS